MDRLKAFKILFVDSNEKIAINYTNYLKTVAMDVFIATDGLEAYKLYKEQKPQIIIMDTVLDKLNGFELIKRVRKDDQETRIIVFSVNSNQEFIDSVLKLNTTTYLVKPITHKQLRDSLLKALDELSSLDGRSLKE